MLLGLFITTLHMPGIPLLLWGEEQALYLLADTTAINYVFGRQPMSSAVAWQAHGCFGLNIPDSKYADWPVDAVLRGCEDELVGRDHRDPTHPVRNIIKSMHALRDNYPVLNDGFNLMKLSNQTREIYLPASGTTPTEIGMWSVVRNQYPDIQELESGNQSVWLVYHNEDREVSYKFDCKKNDTALLSAFPEGTTVKNLLAPYEELELQDGPKKRFFIDKSQEYNGCLDELTLDPWAFKAFVPKSAWVKPGPMLTSFVPGHDARLPSASTVDIELRYSEKMVCDDVTDSIKITSTTEGKEVPKIEADSISCSIVSREDVPAYGSYIPSVWSWKATLSGVEDGVHTITVTSKSDTSDERESVDHLMFRIGQPDNPMVFPQTSNYSRTAYNRASSKVSKRATRKASSKGKKKGKSEERSSEDLVVTHKAAGADQWRYSTNFGSSWSPWAVYEGGNTTIEELPWNGTRRQQWSGDHIILQYWSKKTGSSAHVQHADVDWEDKPPRYFPNLYAQGPYNAFGYDAGMPTLLRHEDSDDSSSFHLMTEWPTVLQLNVWGRFPYVANEVQHH